MLHSITRNHRTFGCPIICADANSQCYLVHLNNAWYNKGHWLTGRPYLAMIASNETMGNIGEGGSLVFASCTCFTYSVPLFLIHLMTPPPPMPKRNVNVNESLYIEKKNPNNLLCTTHFNFDRKRSTLT